MNKHGVIVWLRAIQYKGGNIGSDTEFHISVNGTETRVPANMSTGATRFFDLPVIMQPLQQQEKEIRITVQVTEERETFPDQGMSSQDYVVKPIQGRQTLGPLTVAVRETLGPTRAGALASFVFTFEAEHFEFGQLGVRYVVATHKGWLLVRGENGAKDFSVPHWLSVEVTEITPDREFFTVLEGPLRGQPGSARLRNGVSSLSPTPVRREPPIEMVYHRETLRLEIPGLGVFNVARPPRNPFPVGQTFPVEIPDYPHEGGQQYEKQATFATTWFRIADPEVPDRYLHTGRVSAGCSTVTERERWDEIYHFLINRRRDDRAVATLRVADS